MIAVEGNFMATNPTPRNMMRMGQSAVWESDHFITNNGAITLRFSANGGARRWGAASGAPAVPHPASGTLVADSTSFFQITGITTGRYRITFNHLTAEYSFRQLYKESAGVNPVSYTHLDVYKRQSCKSPKPSPPPPPAPKTPKNAPKIQFSAHFSQKLAPTPHFFFFFGQKYRKIVKS